MAGRAVHPNILLAALNHDGDEEMMDADYEVTSGLGCMLGSSLAERLQAHTILASTCDKTTNECTAYIREALSPLT